MKDLILLLCFLSTSVAIHAQWESLHGPYGGNISDLAQNDSFQFTATDNGIYRSDDNGVTWNQMVIDGLPGYVAEKLSVYQDHVLARVRTGNHLDVKLGFYKSDNNGVSWEEIITPDTVHYVHFAINEFGIYMGDSHHLLYSTDGGHVWNTSSISDVGYFTVLDVIDNKIYVASSNKIYESMSGDIWNEIEVDGLSGNISTIQVFGDIMFLRPESSYFLYRSGDGGNIWLRVPGLILSNPNTNIAKVEDTFVMHDWHGFLRSEDNGLTWELTKFDAFNVLEIISVDSLILVSSFGSGIMRSEDLATTFEFSSQGLDATAAQTIAVDENSIWTGVNYSGLSKQHKSSGLWVLASLPSEYAIHDIIVHQDKIFALVDDYQLFRSDDHGMTWSPLIEFSSDVSRLFSHNQDLLAGGFTEASYSPLYISYNSGNSWSIYDFIIDNEVRNPTTFASHNNTIFTADNTNIYRSADNGSSWEIISEGLILDTCYCFISDLVVTDDLIMALTIGQPFGLRRTFISRDNGASWDFLEDQSEPVNFTGFSFATHKDNILLAVGSIPTNGLFVSFDHAFTWVPFMEGLTTKNISEIVLDEEYMYAATNGQGVWRRKIEDLYTTSISDEPVKSNQISVYPNPSNGNFKLQVDTAIESAGQLKITDIHGRIHLSEKFQNLAFTEINAPYLIPGIYFVSYQTSSGIYTGKMLVHN